ncbi:hypothetical protein O181_079151 [Austropuccinia psidii MF-1]|uniref:Retroviral polymerase SH3-like domain-containing protein n=1 Tax=Austropuccinia psidii MF-1 TaxID=1389203 RepID=A0A9Q3FLB7_9BASI|nr:hypothetical protein [Austropuccinia psidii MF-1]
MLPRFWQYAYSNACFIHNHLPNSHCPESSPYKELYGKHRSVAAIYPFGTEVIVHIPVQQQSHKLHPRGITCKLLPPLEDSGGWLLWDTAKNHLVQSESVVFPVFQRAEIPTIVEGKGSLEHVLNSISLGEVPTKSIFAEEGNAINSLPLAKDVKIPQQRGQALRGPNQHHWKQACMAELDQMRRWDVWEAVNKENGMKTIGHQWVFDVKRQDDGSA